MLPPGEQGLPAWPSGTVTILSTGGVRPHAIPVSTALPVASRRVLLALAPRRESLARLRAEPLAALTVLAAGDVALTAHGRAWVAEEPLTGAEAVVAVALEVDRVQDHGQPRFTIEDGVRWRWTDDEAARRDDEVRAALRDLAGRLPAP